MKATKAQLRKAIEKAGGTLESDGESFNMCEHLQAVAPDGFRWANAGDDLGSFAIAWGMPGFSKRHEFNAREIDRVIEGMSYGLIAETDEQQ